MSRQQQMQCVKDPTKMTGKRILIIDDEYRIREVIKLSLEMMAGWIVLTANSGQEGLKLAIAQQPDAIILDMMMPDLDGTQTLKQLRYHQTTQTIPVFLLTAKIQMSAPEQNKQLGVVKVIEKPFDPLKLAYLIADTLGWCIAED